MSQTHWIFGTFIALGGLLIAESQAGDEAPLSVTDATLVVSITQAGRVIGEGRDLSHTDRASHR